MVNRGSLRFAATLLFVEDVIFILVTLVHSGHAPANNHPAAFAEYARSGEWIAVHVGQFTGTAIIIAGLLALLFTLNVNSGTPGWLVRFAAVAAIAS
jgi:hypothetical protein